MNAATAPTAPSLDIATLTVVSYPDCGESVIYQGIPIDHTTIQAKRRDRKFQVEAWARGDRPDWDVLCPFIIGPKDPMPSRREAARRRRTKLRRWCVAHKVDRLLTFTYAPEHLPASLDDGWKDIERLRRGMSDAGLGAMAVVPENGDKSGRFHFHGTYSGFIDLELLGRLWGKGFVHVRRMRSVRGETARGRSRRVAAYVAGYLAPEGATPDRTESDGGAPGARAGGFGRRAYSVPKGSVPVRTVARCKGIAAAWRHAESSVGQGGRVFRAWCSDDCEDWRGPPTLLLLAH